MIDDLSQLDGPPSALSLPGKAKALERLSAWPPIDEIYLSSANQKQFEHIAALIDPIVLTLDMVKTDDFTPLAGMARLEHLVIDSNARLKDLDFLTALTGLRHLELKAIKDPLDLAPLSHLTALRRLVLDGGFSRTMKAKSVAPLAALKNVTDLELLAIRFEDESLAPLADMTALETLQITNYFPTEAYAWLHAARPDIDCERLAAYSQSQATHYEMTADGRMVDQGKSDYMVTGKRKPFIKPSDAHKLERYVENWNALVARFRQEM